MICTKCMKPITKGQPYCRTRRGAHHLGCGLANLSEPSAVPTKELPALVPTNAEVYNGGGVVMRYDLLCRERQLRTALDALAQAKEMHYAAESEIDDALDKLGLKGEARDVTLGFAIESALALKEREIERLKGINAELVDTHNTHVLMGARDADQIRKLEAELNAK